MIDLHCHILPGLDDGPETIEESIAMCRIAADDGIDTVVAAPHCKPGWFDFTADDVHSRIKALRSILQQEKIAITLIPAAEVSIVPELPSLIATNTYLTINGNDQYFLAEFPGDMVLPRWNEFLSPLNLRGRIPVLAHPERMRWFSTHVDELAKFVEYGGIVQITAASLLGEIGQDIRDLAVELLKRNIAHVIASDGHSIGARPPRLADAVRRAAEIVGDERARAMVTTVPQAIIAGERIIMPAPLSIERAPKKRGFFQRLVGIG
jgi:protein-tyrosine phosphatase